MRNLEDIDRELAAAREALSSVEGTPAEVYSRIVGYYRSVRNWNRGKREEYGERRLYRVSNDVLCAAVPSPSFPKEAPRPVSYHELWPGVSPNAAPKVSENTQGEFRLLLFIRAGCPNCPPAKIAAGKLGIPVDLVNVDTAEGMAEALKRSVLSTPTAILLSPGASEMSRAADAEAIRHLLDIAEPIAV